jgi:predicted metal-dependent hydrolase
MSRARSASSACAREGLDERPTSAIPLRRIRFTYPKDLDAVFIEGDPEFSFVAVALSLALPYLEPYLIRTMNAARPHVTEPELQKQLREFSLQEGQHYQQHRRFNESLRAQGFDALPALEAALAEDYERFSARASLSFNLAYAEGFEALTTSMALRMCELDRSGWQPEVRALFEWHLLEEVEHRCVAFDVYEHVCGNYLNRVRVGSFAQRHLLSFMLRAWRVMVDASTERIEALGGRRAHRRRTVRLVRRLFAPLLPRVVRTHLPWYTPHRLVIPATFSDLAAQFDARADRVDESAM